MNSRTPPADLDVTTRNGPSGVFHLIASGILGLLGIVMLWIGLPRSVPRMLDNFFLFTRGGVRTISMVLEPLGLTINLRVYQLLGILGIIAVALTVYLVRTSPAVRVLVRSFSKTQKIAAGALLWVGLFGFTLFPGRTSDFEPTWSVALGCVWNLLGLALLGAALSPVWTVVGRRPRVDSLLRRGFVLVRGFLYQSPPLLFVGSFSLFVLAAAVIASGSLFGHIPHIQDSIAQLFHAKIFASGHLTAPAPALPEFFQYTHMIMDGRWYSQYPPGHSFILMWGVLAGVPWIVNPLLGATAIVVMYFLGRELYDESTARLGTLLLALSPFVILMSSEFMNHASGMLMYLLFALSFFVTSRKPTPTRGIVVGVTLGWFIAIRPYSAAALAVPFIVYGAILVWKGGREIRWAALSACLALGVSVSLLFLFNYATNGNPFLFGYEKLYGAATNPGFGHGAWGEQHTPARGLQQSFANLNMLNKSLFEWPVPALVFCVLLFASGTKNRRDYFLLAPLILVSAAYFFYWFQDLCFGPRYLYEASPLIVLLTARGIQRCIQVVRDGLPATVAHWKVPFSIGLMVCLLFIIGWSVNLPPIFNEMGNSYWNVDQTLVHEVRQADLHNALVFVSGEYGSGFPQNDPFLEGDVIYARDLESRNALLKLRYPTRTFYEYQRGTLYPLR